MADHTIAADEQGVYEIPLASNESVTVHFSNRDGYFNNAVQINVHDADAPVYVRYGNEVDVRDPKASVVTSGTWITLPDNWDNQFAVTLVCAAAATVSVTRA
jgi:hypothetical protein